MKYITTYFFSFAVILGSIACVNWLVDPFAMYWSAQSSMFNELKSEAGTRTRVTKAYQVRDIAPEILLVGNSRIEMGLSPNSSLFNNKKVYNQGMPGAHVVMQVDYAIDAIKTTPNIKQVFISIDFLDFLLTEQQLKLPLQELDHSFRVNYDFRLRSFDGENQFNEVSRLKEKMSLIFSLDALSASISTISRQNTNTSSIDKHGFNTALSYISIMNSEGIKPLFTQKLKEITTKLSQPLFLTTKTNSYISPRFKHIGRLVDLAKERNIEVTLFINPYHYSYLHTLADNQQWQNFKRWKKSAINYVTERYQDNVTLWDFSGFSEIITEKVTIDTPKVKMKWFWEPAHYRKELGDVMLEIMTKEHTNNKMTFGNKLTSDNITQHLQNDQSGLEKTRNQWKILKEQLSLN